MLQKIYLLLLRDMSSNNIKSINLSRNEIILTDDAHAS